MNSKKYILFFLLLFQIGFSHPLPNSVMLFDIKTKSVHCELQLPLKELQLAIPFNITTNSNTLLLIHRKNLLEYVLKHFSIIGDDHLIWNYKIETISIKNAEQSATGIYKELVVKLLFIPKNPISNRRFTIFYDAITHQVINHKTIVAIRQDWNNGKIGENNTQIGIIEFNNEQNKVVPLVINLNQGSNWKGFKNMVKLGINHIAQGTDHLLFLLVLLLSAPLVSNEKRWVANGGIKYSLIRILKITTAFTIGHSITLLLGTFGWLQPQPKIIEILIAVSILITAVHALRPIFPDKEIYIAAGFGLVHGLAFATVLYNLHLETSKTIISLLGFNIGIELMQLFVIVMIIPWFLILSTNKIYLYIRVIGALFASIAAIAWILERFLEKTNFVATFVQKIANQSLWIFFGLACFTMLYNYYCKRILTDKKS
ncbi:HupE/UreJ family protein [Flavobacterium sp.]|uniref:HupE/UreJ family protein n=1 Tax=Flavobacterium sp. TaxID=239 RepID=UPI0037508919